MFKGILSQPGAGGRAARRLATVAESARRSNQRHMRETSRQSKRQLSRLRENQHQQQQQQRGRHDGVEGRGASAAMQAAWSEAQSAALAQEDAAWAARDPLRRAGENPSKAASPSSSSSSTSTSPLHYDAVDAETGSSVLQQNFNDLVHRALLRYGPPLPVEVVMQNNIVSAVSMSPAQRRSVSRSNRSSSEGGADDPNAAYMDEVGLRMHELMQILRKEKPHFSVREDCDGVPLSLMVRNCNYLRAYGGNVNYMRFVRRLPQEGGDGDEKEGGTMVLSLGKYKMREMPSQDGIRQGPQPWRFSYTTS